MIVDHFYVEDRSGNIYVVIGYTHPPGALVAYRKYAPTSRRTQWCRRIGSGEACYERIVPQYSVEVILETQRLEPDPVFGVEIPLLRLSAVSVVHDPWRRGWEIASHPRDSLEEDYLAIASLLSDISGIPITRIGVTGSILPGIHHPLYSDVDLAIKGCRDAARIVDSIISENLADPIPDLGNWVKNQERLHHVDQGGIRRIYRPWRRGTMLGRIFSITAVEEHTERYGSKIFEEYGPVDGIAYVEPNQCTALLYPAKAALAEFKLLKGSVPRGFNPSYILSYEGIFVPPLYEGGWMRIRGGVAYDGSEWFILIGSRHHVSYIIPIS